MDNFSFKNQIEKRLLELSKQVYTLTKQIPKDKANLEYIDQIIRSSSSIGANYIEANEAESRKDFFHRIKISRKESKETNYWFELIKFANPNLTSQINDLTREVSEFIKLFSSIINSQTK